MNDLTDEARAARHVARAIPTLASHRKEDAAA